MNARPVPAKRRRRPARWVWPVTLLIVVAAAAGVMASGSEGVADRGDALDTANGGSAVPNPANGDSAAPNHHTGCAFWVAPGPEGEGERQRAGGRGPKGDDDAPGTRAEPWATLEHAAAEVPDRSCTVWVEPGVYDGGTNIKRRFATVTTFRSSVPRGAVLENDGTVLDIDGGRNIVVEGFELRHTGSSTPRSDYVAIVDRRKDTWSERITFRDNVFHDSYGDDLLKLHNGVRFATVESNVFYNQGEGEQHIDVNSVTDVTVQDNIFFNDYAASGRNPDRPAKHFVVVKDSNDDDDGLEGSERITVQRNVFLNWQGGQENFVKVGNDGKPYHEARDVRVENNLLIGNSSVPADAAFGVRGARDVTFNNNTVVGDLPGKSFAYRIHLKGDNPDNENIRFTNNVWSDPMGTMGSDGEGGDNRFADSDPSEVDGLVNDTNLYWNGDAPVPPGRATNPLRDDGYGVVADPQLPGDQAGITLPRWTGERFLSGETTVRGEFRRLVEAYGALPATSPALDAANPHTAAAQDILGRVRATPDLGAFEAPERGGP